MTNSRRVGGKAGSLSTGSLIALTAVLVVTSCGGTSAPPAPTPQATETKASDVQVDLPGGRSKWHLPGNASRIGVMVLHGFLESPKEIIAQGWSKASDEHRFVALYPDRSISWNAGLCCGDAAATKRDDVTWLAGAMASMRERFHLTALYLAGNSNGGMMIERLLTERPAVTDRFAVWAAAPEMPHKGPWSGYGYIFARTLDPIVPRAGGTTVIGGVDTRIRPIEGARNWLVGSHLTFSFTKGYGHGTPSDWPDIAWAALTSRP